MNTIQYSSTFTLTTRSDREQVSNVYGLRWDYLTVYKQATFIYESVEINMTWTKKTTSYTWNGDESLTIPTIPGELFTTRQLWKQVDVDQPCYIYIYNICIQHPSTPYMYTCIHIVYTFITTKKYVYIYNT